MPQECLNFWVNSLVCIFFSLLVGTQIDKAHDLAFPRMPGRAASRAGELRVPFCPPILPHTYSSLFLPSPSHNQVKKEITLLG